MIPGTVPNGLWVMVIFVKAESDSREGIRCDHAWFHAEIPLTYQVDTLAVPCGYGQLCMGRDITARNKDSNADSEVGVIHE
jgi:hypothetical protein